MPNLHFIGGNKEKKIIRRPKKYLYNKLVSLIDGRVPNEESKESFGGKQIYCG